jgi:putative membrane protein
MGMSTRLWAAAVLVVISGCSNTEGRKTTPLADGTAVGSGGAGANLGSDGEFVRDLASKNLAEIQLSQMASDRATSPQVKVFAQMLVRDHGTAADALKNAISGQAFEWPAQLDDKDREAVDDLAKKQGPDFDRQYVKAMIEGHQNVAAKLEGRLDVTSLAEFKTSAAGRAQSTMMPDPKAEMADVPVRPNSSDNTLTKKVNEWAASTYPVVQKHLDTARALEHVTKGTSK